MLLVIWPVTALTARVARARHGFRAEFVSAVIEGEAVPTAGQRAAHRYVYEWDLGPTSDLVTPDRAMALLQAAPDLIFPFHVSGGTCIEVTRSSNSTTSAGPATTATRSSSAKPTARPSPS